MNADGSVLAAAVYQGRVYTTVNSGAGWMETCPTGTCENKSWYVVACDQDGSALTAAVWQGQFYTGKRTAGPTPAVNILLE